MSPALPLTSNGRQNNGGIQIQNVLAESHVVDLATAKADYEKSLRDEKAKVSTSHIEVRCGDELQSPARKGTGRSASAASSGLR